MRNLMTYVIAAVFAWCLFVFLPSWAIDKSYAFSDGGSATASARTAPDASYAASDYPTAARTVNYAKSAEAANDTSDTGDRLLPRTNAESETTIPGDHEPESIFINESFSQTARLPGSVRRDDAPPDPLNLRRESIDEMFGFGPPVTLFVFRL